MAVKIIRRGMAYAAIGVALFCTIDSAAQAQAPESANLRFSWKLKGEYAPVYAAKEKGYFAKEGLNVHLGEGAGAPAALGALLQGQEDVVLLPGVFALTAISKGMPIKLIALYNPKTPIALISMLDNPVRTPKDMEGKSLAVSIGETGTSYLDSFCKTNGIDCSKIKRIQVNSQARVAQFLQHKVDVVSVYQTNDLPILQQTQKIPFVVLEMDKNGLAVPGNALVSSDSLIAREPEKLKKLLRAVSEGIVVAKKDPAAAAAMMIKNWPGSPNLSIVTAQVKATVKAIPEMPGKPIGTIDPAVISQALQMLKGTGEIDSVKPLDTYFTNALLSTSVEK
jgi:NitT/TauT family transport system substrate-binding protein